MNYEELKSRVEADLDRTEAEGSHRGAGGFRMDLATAIVVVCFLSGMIFGY